MLKMRVRVKDVAIIKDHFINLLEDAFDDIFPKSVSLVEAEIEDESKLSKKRSRQSELDVTEDSTTKKTSRSLKKEGEDETITAVPSLRMTYNQKVRTKLPSVGILKQKKQNFTTRQQINVISIYLLSDGTEEHSEFADEERNGRSVSLSC